ncbi:hypothetical protein DPMN_031375 [Dreissena polymorpha]|uniref:Uncharacterized protein n=1 Tax=Dreissena polymorpha TaxID=45954 RepID=A0A9D4M241_DREPO|nr:hypothetical protein DPMN_031375 [Dreissena polymorpha]
MAATGKTLGEDGLLEAGLFLAVGIAGCLEAELFFVREAKIWSSQSALIAACILPPKRESAVKGAILSEFTPGSNKKIEAHLRPESDSSQAIYKVVAACSQAVTFSPTWKATGIFGKVQTSSPYGLTMAM